MFLVFTGFRARLGMTMTDKRSHGGRDRIQEQGEIGGPSHFVPTHRIASQRWFETCPGWFMRLQFCHNRQIPQSFHFKKLLQCSEGWHEQQAKHGKTKCSNIRLSYPGVLEPALAYVSGTCLGWHAAFGIARCRSTTNDKGPKKSGWFCLTLLSQATGQSFDMFSWPGLAPGIGQRSHRALGQFACSVGRATSRWIRFQTNASMQILGHLWTETGNILDIHVWHFDYDDHQTSQDVARKNRSEHKMCSHFTAVTASSKWKSFPRADQQPGGFYAAALTQFWLENGPVWKTQRSLSAVQLSAGGRTRLMAQLATRCFRYVLSLQ